MTALLLRLGGPMQSWGTLSVKNERSTLKHPTRSGLIGMIAAAEGHGRAEDLARYRPLRFDIRIDRPGELLVDYHTVGGGRPAHLTVPISSGGHRPAGQGTIVSHRHYRTDAVFTVALSSEDETLLQAVRSALLAPHWAPYLGRRSCPPDGPLVLAEVDDGRHWLQTRLPLARESPRDDADIAVDFLTDTPLDAPAPWVESVPDEPESFHDSNRRYRYRDIHRYRRSLPSALCGGRGIDYLDALATALETRP
ncbi:type I-E CRISPR-associated protein Cas5/CasD [Saccharothrix longispora]|uniref:type I-E CRISPR-associated protein Cas5/CasD n=1 Tax=Saccharothrix longispora TaxID=33920 RepID=UPI0028FD3A21|nr:type I-E CRISPR-associated protein Cas5/CasD [Saccharothrix longispora]MDU0289566.1 type I-E CRISPR-associated protein Cas5/CasD [Saccharothrix longispora]